MLPFQVALTPRLPIQMQIPSPFSSPLIKIHCSFVVCWHLPLRLVFFLLALKAVPVTEIGIKLHSVVLNKWLYIWICKAVHLLSNVWYIQYIFITSLHESWETAQCLTETIIKILFILQILFLRGKGVNIA